MTSAFSNTFGTLLTLSPYHVLIFGTLLGTEIYQSFVATGICFRALPTSAFTTLQKRLFPAYFRLQALLTLLTIATHPPRSILSLVDHWYEATPLGICAFLSLLNLNIYGPRTSDAMVERIHQETRDRMNSNGVDGKSDEMKLLDKKFSRNHAMSIHLNFIAILATVWYGVVLSSKLQV